MTQQTPDNVYVLSPLQQGLLFHSLQSPDAGLYIEQTVMTLSGAVDTDALARAVRHTAVRHGALRTTFHWKDLDKPLQVVRREVAVPIEVHDWTAWSGEAEEARRERLESFLAADRRRGFDLSTPPLFRVAVVRLDAASSLLIWAYHHILLDGWSSNILDGETLAAYVAILGGRTPDGPPVRQFGDYIHWLRGRDAGAAEAFWRARMAGFTAPTPLGIDYPAAGETHGQRDLFLSPAATAALRALARRRQLTLNTLIQGAWALLLYASNDESDESEDSDIVFGATVSGRPAEIPGVESIVGLFINSLPVRVRIPHSLDDLATGDGLAGWLREIQNAQAAGQPHEHASLADIQRWSEVPAGQPLFETLVVFENVPTTLDAKPAMPESAGPGEAVLLSQRSVLHTNYPLVLKVVPGERLGFEMTYRGRRFSAVTAARLLGHLGAILGAFTAEPPALLSPLSQLTGPERHQLLHEWNDTAADYPRDRTLPELFAEVARRQPDAVAVELEGVRWTYGELDARTDRLAGRLRQAGVGPEVRVGLAAEETPALVEGMLGILKAGGAYVPLDPAYPEERLERMIATADLRVLVAADNAPTAWPADRAIVRISRPSEPGVDSRHFEPVDIDPQNLAYVLFTSGSSGQPKGVGVPHRAIARLVLGSGFARLGPETRIAQVSNTAFDAATFEVWGALLTGGTLVGVPRSVVLAPAAFAERLRRERITTMFLTAALFRLMARETPDAFRGLTDLLVGGEAVDPHAAAAVLQAGAPSRLIDGYGPTECTTFAMTWPIALADTSAPLPIGRPIANTRGHVLDRAMRPAPVGVTGELWLGGDGLARGYLGRPERTAESFRPDPFATEPGSRLYRTGDLVRQRPDGAVDLLRRIDLQVKIRGFRIEIGEVEAALVSLPEVAAAVVMAREDATGERRLVAYVVPRASLASLPPSPPSPLPCVPHSPAPNGRGAPPPDPNNNSREDQGFLSPGGGGWAADIRRDLARKLPAYMVPAAFNLLPALPLNANGKIDRAALARLANEADGDIAPRSAGVARKGFAAPRTPVEELLAGLWSAVLGVDPVGIHDDFLELGGHSLLATQLLSRIREAFRVELPLASLFEEATVAGQAARVVAVLKEQESDGLAAPPLVARAGGTEAPLSFAQQRLWILDRFDPGLPAYNIPLAIQLTGPVRPAALQGALAAVVARHAALRTHFAVTAAGPVQRIEEATIPALPRIDLSGLPAPRRGAELELQLGRLGTERFDLGRGPLLRAALFATGPDEQVLLLNVHHIIADGWSLGILFRETAACYTAACEGRATDLPPLPIQYADFAVWQRHWLQGEVLERQLAFWRERLAGSPAGSPLTTDRPRPALQTFNGALAPVAFPPGLAAAAHRLARAERVTPFMALIAVFAELLGRLSGWDDLAIGTPVANRNRLETEGLIGFFVNTLVLRANVGPEPGEAETPTVRRLLARLRDVTLAATAHQDLPFEKLVEELRPERSLALSPFFQVFFTLESASAPPPLAGAEAGLYGIETGASKFDLTLSLTRGGEGIGGAIEYNTDLFDRTTAARLGGHFLTLLAGFAAHPERPAASLPLLADRERQQLLREWNDTGSSRETEETLTALFARQAERTPEAVALVHDAGGASEITYRELAERAGSLAGRLRQAEVGPETPVGIFLDRGPALVIALLGVLAAGGAYVPLDPAYPRERLAATLDDCRAPWIVTRRELADRLPGGRAGLVLVDTEGWVESEKDPQVLRRGGPRDAARHPVWPPSTVRQVSNEPGLPENLGLEFGGGSWAEPSSTQGGHAGCLTASCGPPLQRIAAVPRIDPGNLAYLIYTSGSTGKPKGVAIEHRSAAALLAWAREAFSAADLAAVFASTSVCFDLSVFEIFAPLTTGGTVVLAENALDLAALRHLRGVTLVNTVPSAAAELLRAGAFPPTLRTLNLAGEPIPAALAARLALLPGRVLNLYGPSETTTYSSVSGVSTVRGGDRQPPIGRPIAGTEILLLDRRQQPVAIGVPGEIHIAGAGLARGYFGSPTLTAASFLPHTFAETPGSRVYRTGDLARALPDGRLEFLGRRDHQVKVRGFRIETGEIETVLAAHPAVAEAIVMVRHESGAPQLAAYIVPRAAGSPLAAELRSALRQRLPEFMIPAAIVEIAALPRTPTGKVDRAALPPPDATPGAADSTVANIAPRTDLEKTIAAAVREIMGVERVGATASFFDLGGNSLLLIRLAARLEEQLGRPVQPLDLFRAPSVAALARFLAGPGEGEDEAQPDILEAPSGDRNQARNRRREMRRAAATAGETFSE